MIPSRFNCSQASARYTVFQRIIAATTKFNGAYHVNQQPPGFYNWCGYHDIFSNFTFEVSMTIVQGNCGGIVFRADGQGNSLHLYYYAICANGGYNVANYRDTSAADV